MADFNTVTEFENKIAEFFGSPYGVAVDSCTHGLELCLRHTEAKSINCPRHTYVSVPMLANKLGIGLNWRDDDWKEFYPITENIIDAAVLFRRDSYIPGTFMVLSFQHKKHLNIGRGGMILLDDRLAAYKLKCASYDGRVPDVPWREQDISEMGYHYYLLPELAEEGLRKINLAMFSEPRKWQIYDWPDVSQFKVFKK